MTKFDKYILYHYTYAALYGDLSQSRYGTGKNQSSTSPLLGKNPVLSLSFVGYL